MSNVYFIVNSRLTYVSTQFVLEWVGIKPKKILYTSYHDAEEKIDEFLFEFVDKEDSLVFLMGYQKDKTKELVDIFKWYKFKTLESDSDKYDNIFQHVVKNYIEKIKDLSLDQIYYIKCMNQLLNYDYRNNDAYFLNILFYNMSVDYFYKAFRKGYGDIKPLESVIYKHIEKFQKQDSELFELSGYYFVLSTVEFLTDYIFKYGKKIPNICIIDLNSKRVYFKQLKKESKDVNILCDKLCKNKRGFKNYCSGEITDQFLEVTKRMKPYE